MTAPCTLDFREEPSQPLRPDQARLKTLYSGLSHGTEMNIYRGRNVAAQGWGSYPFRCGYSAVGEVIEVGPDFKGAGRGDLVFGYAPHAEEFFLSNRQPLYLLPAGLDKRCGVFLALAGVAYNGVLESRIALGETAVVFGLGVVGLCACYQVHRAGAFRVIGVDPVSLRRKAALQMGVDAAIDPGAGDIQEQVKAANDGNWADVVIETSGAIKALNDAIKVIKNQSTIVALSWYSTDASALDLTRDFHYRRVHIRVAQSDSIPLELSSRWTHDRKVRSALQLLPQMPLQSLITHSFPFQDARQAYELVDQHPEGCIQVLLRYQDEQ